MKKQIRNRLASCVLALMLVAGLMPQMVLSVNAESDDDPATGIRLTAERAPCSHGDDQHIIVLVVDQRYSEDFRGFITFDGSKLSVEFYYRTSSWDCNESNRASITVSDFSCEKDYNATYVARTIGDDDRKFNVTFQRSAGHTGQKITKAATCTSPGTATWKDCFFCKTSGSKEIPIDDNAHKWGEWKSNGDGTHTRVCTYNPDHTETENCTGGGATCTTPGNCDICGSVYTDSNNHSKDESKWVSTGNGSHFHPCAYGCDAQYDTTECSGGISSCIAQAECDICHEPYGGMGGHSLTYSADGNSLTESCTNKCSADLLATLKLPDNPNLIYTGTAVEPLVMEYPEGWRGVQRQPEPEHYRDNLAAGTATCDFLYEGQTVTGTFNVMPAELQDITAADYSGVYNGQPHGITVSAIGVDGKAAAVKYGTAEGTYDLDTSPTITKAGSITVYYQVTLANHHSVTGSQTVTIAPKDLSAVVELPSGVYTGEVHVPSVSELTYEGLHVKEGTDYELGQWSGERITPGVYTIPITGKGNYSGTTDLIYTIQNANLTDVSIKQVGSLTYNGKPQIPVVDVTALSKGNQGVIFTYSMTQDGTYGNPPGLTEAGEYLVYCKASAAYHNDAFTTFCVTVSKAAGSVMVSMDGWAYGEEASTPVVISETNDVTQVSYFYKEASADDSTYTENCPVNAGNYTVKAVVAETNNYTEAVATADFTISRSNTKLTAADFVYAPPADLIYNGTAKAATVTAAETLTGVGEITVKYDRDPVNAGSCKVFIDVAQGRNYNAVTDLTGDDWIFTIAKADPGIFWEEAVEGILMLTYNTRPQGEAKIILVNGETFAGAVQYTSETSGGESITGLPTDAGDYTVTAYFPEQPNYNAATDSIEVVIKIKEVTPTVVLTPETYSFDGQAHMPAVKVLDGEHEIPASEYRVEYGNHIAVGAANAWVLDNERAGNYMIPRNTKGVFLILPDASALEGVTVENVTSSHQAAIDAIQAAMEGKNITEASETAQKKWNDLLAFCADLEARIRDVEAAIDAITEGTAALPQQPTTDDLPDIQEILDQYAAIEGNLTEEEKEILADEIEKLEELKEAIEKTNADLKEITDGIEALKKDDLDYGDKETIADLQNKIDALEPNPYLSDGQKQTLDDAETDLEELMAEYSEAEKVEEQLEALPATSNPDDGKNVESYEAAKKAYEDLGADKGKVNPDSVKKLDKLKTALTAYKITRGSGSKWVKGSSENLSFTANGYFGKFSGVKIDGKLIDTDNYAAQSGSTIVTLKANYLKTLKTGKHTISILFGDGDFEGAASCEFQVVTFSGNPFTGDSSNILLWAGMAMTSLLCMTAMVLSKKKRA